MVIWTTLSQKISRLKPVLCNFLEANGSNHLVESKRGNKHAKVEDVLKICKTIMQMTYFRMKLFSNRKIEPKNWSSRMK